MLSFSVRFSPMPTPLRTLPTPKQEGCAPKLTPSALLSRPSPIPLSRPSAHPRRRARTPRLQRRTYPHRSQLASHFIRGELESGRGCALSLSSPAFLFDRAPRSVEPHSHPPFYPASASSPAPHAQPTHQAVDFTRRHSFPKPQRTDRVLLYCRSGRRSGIALEICRGAGWGR